MNNSYPTKKDILVKGLLDLVPYAGSSLSGAYEGIRQRRVARASECIDSVISQVGAEQLAERIESNEYVEILFMNSINLASSTAYGAKRNLLAKAVATAVEDDAKIERATLIFYALRDLDEPHIKALVRLRNIEDSNTHNHNADQASDNEDRSFEDAHNAVVEASKQEELIIISALTKTGVAEPATLFNGGHAILRVSDFGRLVLADLEIDPND